MACNQGSHPRAVTLHAAGERAQLTPAGTRTLPTCVTKQPQAKYMEHTLALRGPRDWAPGLASVPTTALALSPAAPGGVVLLTQQRFVKAICGPQLAGAKPPAC